MEKEKTELDNMTAPPAYSRGKKKSAKEKIIQPILVPLMDLALPVPMDFGEFRRKVNDIFDSIASTV